MKNHYDKIFLALAFLLMLGSVGFFFAGNTALDSLKAKTSALKAKGAQGEAWENKEVKTNLSKTMSWRYPNHQDDLATWLFQVFTPPRIWLDADGNFTAIAPKVEVVKVEVPKKEAVCQLEFVEITSAKYPVVLLGYVGSLYQFRNDADASAPIEFNGKEGQELSYKDPKDLLGKTYIDLGLIFLSAKKEKINNNDGSITEVVSVQIKDNKLDTIIELRTDRETTLDDQRKIILQSINEAKAFPISKVGEVIDYDGSKYKVEELSFEDGFVVLAQEPEDSETLPAKHRLTLVKETVVDEKTSTEEASSVE